MANLVQVIVKIDKDLKERVKKKLKKQGLTLSGFFRLVTIAYINGDLDVKLLQKNYQAKFHKPPK